MKTRVCAFDGEILVGDDIESMGDYVGLDFYCYEHLQAACEQEDEEQ